MVGRLRLGSYVGGSSERCSVGFPVEQSFVFAFPLCPPLSGGLSANGSAALGGPIADCPGSLAAALGRTHRLLPLAAQSSQPGRKIGQFRHQTSPRNRPISISPTTPTDIIPTPANDDAAALALRQNEIHLIAQGKAGVGKTFVARLLAAYLEERLTNLLCVDADPGSRRFSREAGVAARCLSVDANGYANFAPLWDQLAEPGLSTLIDVGPSGYLPLLRDLQYGRPLDAPLAAGKTVFAHVVIAGGTEASTQCVQGLAHIMALLPRATRLVVWLNEVAGPVTLDGRDFLDSPAYQDLRDRLHAIIRIPKPVDDIGFSHLHATGRRQATVLHDTADQPGHDASEPVSLVHRQRLRSVQRDVSAMLAAAAL